VSGPALSRIALGVDLARRQDHVIDRASRLPLRAGAHVTVMHVLPRDAQPAEGDVVVGLRAIGAVLLARRPDVTLDVVVGRGDPAEQLARSADGSGSELLVVGRSAPRRALRISMRTTAERASLRTDIPVLAVRPGPGAPYRRLLAGIESPASLSARSIEVARRLVEDGACEGHVIHALDEAIEMRMNNAGAPRAAIVMARRWRRSRLRAEISAWLEGDLGERRLHVQLERGDPGRMIIDHARRVEPDLVVLGVDHHWLRGRFLRSSVAGAVLARAGCDVLIVRATRTRAVAKGSARAAA